MCYRGGRGVVPTDESTSIRNCGDAYDGIRLGQTMAKFRGWPRDMVMQMRLWHIGVAEPPCEPRQIDLEHLSMSYDEYREHEQVINGDRPGAFVNVIQAWTTTEIYDMSGRH